jgi:hypothetical protein
VVGGPHYASWLLNDSKLESLNSLNSLKSLENAVINLNINSRWRARTKGATNCDGP